MEPALRYPLRVRLLCPSNPRVLSPPTPFASLPLLSLSLPCSYRKLLKMLFLNEEDVALMNLSLLKVRPAPYLHI
jgi:hypothetical protein